MKGFHYLNISAYLITQLANMRFLFHFSFSEVQLSTLQCYLLKNDNSIWIYRVDPNAGFWKVTSCSLPIINHHAWYLRKEHRKPIRNKEVILMWHLVANLNFEGIWQNIYDCLHFFTNCLLYRPSNKHQQSS